MTQIKQNMKQDPQTYAVIGAAMEVHRQLGHGFLEAVYQEALVFEFVSQEIPYQREVELPVFYKGQRLRCGYRADFICYDSLVVETKAISRFTTADEAQTINELKATGYNRGILLNFGSPSLEYKRLVHNLRESAKSADNSLE
jgi:GxxExxY protein